MERFTAVEARMAALGKRELHIDLIYKRIKNAATKEKARKLVLEEDVELSSEQRQILLHDGYLINEGLYNITITW